MSALIYTIAQPHENAIYKWGRHNRVINECHKNSIGLWWPNAIMLHCVYNTIFILGRYNNSNNNDENCEKSPVWKSALHSTIIMICELNMCSMSHKIMVIWNNRSNVSDLQQEHNINMYGRCFMRSRIPFNRIGIMNENAYISWILWKGSDYSAAEILSFQLNENCKSRMNIIHLVKRVSRFFSLFLSALFCVALKSNVMIENKGKPI